MIWNASLFSCLLLVFQSCHFGSLVEGEQYEITVATYNLWNVMFNWEVRKLRIAQMIRTSGADVIGFQEVRADARGARNQVEELRQLVARYRWSHFQPSGNVTLVKGSYIKEWEIEGIGILSRYPIIKITPQKLAYHNGPDKNQRIVLHASLAVGNKVVNVAVLHLSYDRQQQCGNVAEVLEYIIDHRLKNCIVLGDFNTYRDFEFPSQIFTSHVQPDNKCFPNLGKIDILDSQLLQDAWTTVHPTEKGLTFSNMPEPGLVSRPDRIHVSMPYKVMEARLLGNGSTYRDYYQPNIRWARLESVLGAGQDAYFGLRGFSCRHDCGPHASCRCGVCVSGGDQNMCETSECPECSAKLYGFFLVFSALLTALVLQFLYALLRVLLTLNEQRQMALAHSLGLNCCLCNPKLYSSMSTTIRRSRYNSICRYLPCCHMPPFFHVVFSMFCILLLCVISQYIFEGSLNTVYAVIPEELHPSDHLMLIAKLQLTG